MIIASLAAAFAMTIAPSASAQSHDSQAASMSIRAAVCPIVYPVDQATFDRSPDKRGIHYLFYGNGFFINKDGYLITAAHVLSQLHGGQPYVLIHPDSSPSRVLPARLVAVDIEHDVAILRASPNPFPGSIQISFLPLSTQWQKKSANVMVAALFPENMKDPHTGDALLDNNPSGEVIDYEFSALYSGKPETELFLFSHEIDPGQSGAPVLRAGSDGVVGLVEGRWLRENAATLGAAANTKASGIGAAIPIHYAIWLLQQRGIAWQPAEDSALSGAPTGEAIPANLPVPLSLVAAPYPKQSLTGGEVVLDVLVDPKGRLAEIRVIRGEDPFLSDVLAAVRTWSFKPAHEAGRAVFARIGIAFQFPQSLNRAVPSSTHAFETPPAHAGERAALPVVTVEPSLQADAAGEGSVVLYEAFDAQGGVTSTRVLQGSQSLIPATQLAAQAWHFAPALHADSPLDSAAILVFTFRRSALAPKGRVYSSTE